MASEKGPLAGAFFGQWERASPSGQRTARLAVSLRQAEAWLDRW